MTTTEQWLPSTQFNVLDILRWHEPLWAAPNKPRGKPDKIGEQEITARLLAMSDFLEFEVMAVKNLTEGDAVVKVQAGDKIRRKRSTIDLGNCHKQVTAEA